MTNFPLPNPLAVFVDPAGANSDSPATAPASGPAGTTSTSQVSAGSFLKWTIAIAALWAILVALHEYGGTAQDVGTGFALLVMVSTLLVLGPKAVQNLQGSL